MSDRTEFLDPEFEPGEFDRVERQLRTALAEDARRVHPGNRLDAILHEAHEAGPVTATGGSGPRRWLIPVAAAAAVAAIIGGVWWSNQDPTTTPSPPANTGPSVSVTTPPATATDQPTTPPSSTSSAPPATTRLTLPAYFVGPQGDPEGTPKLFREFLPAQVPADPSDADKARAALALAVNAQPYTNTDGYLQPWSGQRIVSVTVTDTITIDLANPGNPDAAVTEEIRRLAVQELVWTAQAAVGKGTLPVKLTVNGSQADLFGSISTDQAFNRPPSDRLYEDVAPIWVTSPARDQVLPAAKPVSVKGLAIVFEANVSWQLKRGATQLRTGHTTASIGAPMQGEYTIDLGVLAPGDYTIRVFEMSMKDGDTVHAEKQVSFSVK
jgi:hypothetical protein